MKKETTKKVVKKKTVNKLSVGNQEILSFLMKKMEKDGVSFYALSKLTGKSEAGLYNIKTGNRGMNASTFFELCAALNITVTELSTLIKRFKELREKEIKDKE